MATRSQNEHDFPYWEELPDGGRRYWKVKKGRIFGFAHYVKVVDEAEKTISIVQEVYNDEGQLIERHPKYPVDTGHEYLVPPEDGKDKL
jgi:hypothetical protein